MTTIAPAADRNTDRPPPEWYDPDWAVIDAALAELGVPLP